MIHKYKGRQMKKLSEGEFKNLVSDLVGDDFDMGVKPNDIGLDSLSLLSLISAIHTKTGIRIPLMTMYDQTQHFIPCMKK